MAADRGNAERGRNQRRIATATNPVGVLHGWHRRPDVGVPAGPRHLQQRGDVSASRRHGGALADLVRRLCRLGDGPLDPTLAFYGSDGRRGSVIFRPSDIGWLLLSVTGATVV